MWPPSVASVNYAAPLRLSPVAAKRAPRVRGGLAWTPATPGRRREAPPASPGGPDEHPRLSHHGAKRASRPLTASTLPATPAGLRGPGEQRTAGSSASPGSPRAAVAERPFDIRDVGELPVRIEALDHQRCGWRG